MSALPLKADMCGATRDVRFGPIADMAALFDHLVGGVEEPFRDRQGECLSGLEIDHELELGWLLHRQIGRCTPQRVGNAHRTDQMADLRRHGGTTRSPSRLPAPIRLEARSVPAQNGFPAGRRRARREHAETASRANQEPVGQWPGKANSLTYHGPALEYD